MYDYLLGGWPCMSCVLFISAFTYADWGTRFVIRTYLCCAFTPPLCLYVATALCTDLLYVRIYLCWMSFARAALYMTSSCSDERWVVVRILRYVDDLLPNRCAPSPRVHSKGATHSPPSIDGNTSDFSSVFSFPEPSSLSWYPFRSHCTMVLPIFPHSF